MDPSLANPGSLRIIQQGNFVYPFKLIIKQVLAHIFSNCLS